MQIDPQFISLSTKTRTPIHRDDPLHYGSNIEIDIIYGEEQKTIGIARAFEVRMDQIVNDGEWSLIDVFDNHSSDLSGLYEELFEDDELNPAIADELMDYGNVVLIKSIVLMPEYRGQGLGGLLALAIAERFSERDIVALKPWPMNAGDPDCIAGGLLPPALSDLQQKAVASKLRKGYMKAGFKPFFRGSDHLFLTHFDRPSVSDMI
ncbi:MAG: GNAT family N-acetyltransferase [Geobacteraceae bacterium]|nr:GNAT family N-acetyltransferase [Geobacteraceae bacterium]